MKTQGVFLLLLLFLDVIVMVTFNVRGTQAFTASPSITQVTSAKPTDSPTVSSGSSQLTPTITIKPVDNRNFIMIAACFGVKSLDAACSDKSLADLDGDGVVDGIDYNLFLIAIKSTLTLTPIVSIAPTGADTITPFPTDTPVFSPTPVDNAPVTTGNRGPGWLKVLSMIVAILLIMGGIFIFFSRKKYAKKPKTPKSVVPPQTPAGSKPSPTPDQPIAKSFFVKPVKLNSTAQTVELKLVDDSTQITGIYHYQGKEVKEGFANIKGILKTENGKQHIVISDLTYIG